jgi:ATP-binding cassette subfamily B protein
MSDKAAAVTAATYAGIAADIERLPGQYDTVLSRSYDRGADLSVGQWQRIAVARAFFRQSPILILDEPAASLDALAEQALVERLEELVSGRTTLMISHRFSTVRKADKILVMADGRIVESGSHGELMAVRGRYADLFSVQAKGYLPDPAE